MIELDITKRLHMGEGEQNLSVSMQIEAGEFIALFGKSGAGKTTLLRIIAGLTEPDSGILTVNGGTWIDTQRRISIPARKRNVGFVFQDYALFPNMTVQENIAFAADGSGEVGLTDELIELMELDELRGRKPDRLSGGQRQRVALARALVRRPPILLLDEPLSALDSDTRHRLQELIARVHSKLNVTVLLVSHDIGEVFRLSQRVFCLENGKIVSQGKPSQVFHDRKTRGRFELMGEVLEILPSDIVYEVTLLVGNQLMRVVATEDEIKDILPGDRVTLLSKAYGLMLLKL